jgi:hypothetical protein
MQVVIEVKQDVKLENRENQLLAQLDAVMEYTSQNCHQHPSGNAEAWGVLTDLNVWHFYRAKASTSNSSRSNSTGTGTGSRQWRNCGHQQDGGQRALHSVALFAHRLDH